MAHFREKSEVLYQLLVIVWPILMTPGNEALSERLARICFEGGLLEILNEAEQKTKGQFFNYILRGLCYGLAGVKLASLLKFLLSTWYCTKDQRLHNNDQFAVLFNRSSQSF